MDYLKKIFEKLRRLCIFFLVATTPEALILFINVLHTGKGVHDNITIVEQIEEMNDGDMTDISEDRMIDRKDNFSVATKTIDIVDNREDYMDCRDYITVFAHV